MELNIYWYIAITLYVILNIFVTVFLSKREELEPFQKGAQIFLVWLIPYLAAVGLWLLNKDQTQSNGTAKTFGGGTQDSGLSGGVNNDL